MIGSRVEAQIRHSSDIAKVGESIKGTYLGIAYYGQDGEVDTYLMVVDDVTGLVVDVKSTDIKFIR